MTPEALATACAEAMWREDKASPGLGMILEHVAPGRARLSMPVLPHMLNGVGTCHGGFMFSLADSAFAFACNSYGMRAVAAHCSITFLRPVHAGETLTAIAALRHAEGRTGLYDAQLTVAGAVVAEFRGTSRTTGHSWFPTLPEE